VWNLSPPTLPSANNGRGPLFAPSFRLYWSLFSPFSWLIRKAILKQVEPKQILSSESTFKFLIG
jgi:hypothetical protein